MKNNFFSFPVANINSKPSLNSEVTSQILYGEKFKILNKKKGWVKNQEVISTRLMINSRY